MLIPVQCLHLQLSLKQNTHLSLQISTIYYLNKLLFQANFYFKYPPSFSPSLRCRFKSCLQPRGNLPNCSSESLRVLFNTYNTTSSWQHKNMHSDVLLFKNINTTYFVSKTNLASCLSGFSRFKFNKCKALEVARVLVARQTDVHDTATHAKCLLHPLDSDIRRK